VLDHIPTESEVLTKATEGNVKMAKMASAQNYLCFMFSQILVVSRVQSKSRARRAMLSPAIRKDAGVFIKIVKVDDPNSR
jgi:hypothetical protein